jgi:hypothetical protein
MFFPPPPPPGHSDQGSSSSNQDYNMMLSIDKDPLVADIGRELMGLVMNRQAQTLNTNPRTGKKYPDLSQAVAGYGPSPPAHLDDSPFMLPPALDSKDIDKFQNYLRGGNTFSMHQELPTDPFVAVPNLHNPVVNRSANMVPLSNLQTMHSFQNNPYPALSPYPGAFAPIHGGFGFPAPRHASGPQLGASSAARPYHDDQRTVSLPTHLDQENIYKAMGERVLDVVEDRDPSMIGGGRLSELSLSSQFGTNVGFGFGIDHAGVNGSFNNTQFPTQKFPEYSIQADAYRSMYGSNASAAEMGGPSGYGLSRGQPPIVPTNGPHVRVSSYPSMPNVPSNLTPRAIHQHHSASYPEYQISDNSRSNGDMSPTQSLDPSTKWLALRKRRNGGPGAQPSAIMPNQPYHATHPSQASNFHHENLPDEINCALWITNIPVSANSTDIFNTINVGAVASLHINQPDAYHTCKAAKLVFKEPSAAAQYLMIATFVGIPINGSFIKAKYNRHGHLRWAGTQTRVIKITGPDHLMDWVYWNGIFKDICHFEYDHCNELPCNEPGRKTFQFHFERIDGQAQMCLKAVFQDPNHADVYACYGRDRCEPQPAQLQ